MRGSLELEKGTATVDNSVAAEAELLFAIS